MAQFGQVSVQGLGEEKFLAVRNPDGRSLSILFTEAEVRDQGDSGMRYSALSFDIDIGMDGKSEADICSVDIRGASQLAGDQSFGVFRMRVAEERAVVGTAEISDVFVKHFDVPLSGRRSLPLSLLALANGGNGGTDEAYLNFEAIDLMILRQP